MRIAVIGGGLSGLTAAFYLHRALPEAELSVFESGSSVGGVIQTERRGPWLVEHGADCFSVRPGDALRLCHDLGAADELIAPLEDGRLAMIAQGNRLYRVPEGFVLMRPTRLWQVLSSPLLSWRGKLRLAAERFVPAAIKDEDESLASFVRRRLGRETLDRLVQPLVAGIYTGDAERLSMQATMPQFLEMERQHGSLTGRRRSAPEAPRPTGDASAEVADVERHSSGARYGQFRVFPEGMQRLFDELTATLPAGTIQTGCEVTSCTRDQDARWRLEVRGNAGEMTRVVDGVLVALPAPAAARVIEHVAPQPAAELGAIEYASSAIVLVGAKTSQFQRLPSAFGFVVPAIEQRPILAASFASHKFPGRAPDAHTLVRVFIGGALQPRLLERSDAELREIALSQLAELIGLQGAPEWTEVRRWNRAMPQYHVGHRERAARIEAGIATLPGLEIAGNALHGVGIAPVVGTARRAAERLVTFLQQHRVG